ncbi:hypothetical protein GGR56DRAFT_201207 [Xylariaceae sp. FL0804]|nr:hypothetical protein GGR56DRAFT_201207 [Xylariaceae sp. FL0804]
MSRSATERPLAALSPPRRADATRQTTTMSEPAAVSPRAIAGACLPATDLLCCTADGGRTGGSSRPAAGHPRAARTRRAKRTTWRTAAARPYTGSSAMPFSYTSLETGSDIPWREWRWACRTPHDDSEAQLTQSTRGSSDSARAGSWRSVAGRGFSRRGRRQPTRVLVRQGGKGSPTTYLGVSWSSAADKQHIHLPLTIQGVPIARRSLGKAHSTPCTRGVRRGEK